MAKQKPIIAMSAPVTITAGESEGDKKSLPKFTATFYTGGQMDIDGWDLPVVVDLAGLDPGNVLVANLDHDRTKRVGNFAVANDGQTLVANGTASARTPARDEVVGSAEDGYLWQASLEVNPREVEEIKKGKTAEANGRKFDGPIYVTRKGTLKGFGFVSHGADDNTSVTIAAKAASQKEQTMKAEVKAWASEMLPSLEIDALSADEITNLENQYAGLNPVKPKKKLKLDDAISAKQEEVERIDAISDYALNSCDKRPYDIDAIKALAEQAIEGKWSVDKFRMEMLEASIPPAHSVFAPRGGHQKGITDKVIEAAICKTGMLKDYEKQFDDQTLQIAHDRFKNGIGLKQVLVLAAQANGYTGSIGYDVDINVQRAAFGQTGPHSIKAQGFSTLSLPEALVSTANRFIREGWMHVDRGWQDIASVRSVRDFKQITTISLTGSLMFEQLGPDGEIKHGTLGETTYTNQADTYARMFAITRKDIINDDLDALTSIPRRLGRGAALTMNNAFWTEFLNPSVANFWHANNNNVNTGVADMTLAGLTATELIFMNQTDPDGLPLGVTPQIIAVPSALKALATALMDPQGRLITGATSTTLPDVNVFAGRFKVVSSPYMSNSSYTGYSASAWYMLASPSDIPVIEVVALNGRIEPTVDTADTDFNTLGIQMRGYCDVGVTMQEPRGGVRADGGSS